MDTIGNFVTKELTEECHPKAVPCQVGPVFNMISSGGVNVSLEEVKKSYEEKS